MQEKIQKAIEILNQGGVIVYPTDTAFGIGCRMDNEAAIRRLFAIRRRPESQATPVLLDSLEMAKRYIRELPENVEKKLIQHYWPGALTIVLQSDVTKVPELVRGGTTTIGIRIPNHETTLSLINGMNVPLIGPSANFHGEATPYRFEDLDPALLKLVDYVLLGECPVKQASTVVDCTVTPWKILRQGAVNLTIEE